MADVPALAQKVLLPFLVLLAEEFNVSIANGLVDFKRPQRTSQFIQLRPIGRVGSTWFAHVRARVNRFEPV